MKRYRKHGKHGDTIPISRSGEKLLIRHPSKHPMAELFPEFAYGKTGIMPLVFSRRLVLCPRISRTLEKQELEKRTGN